MEKGQGKGTDTLQTDNVFTRKEYIEREAFISEQRRVYCNGCNRRKGMKNGKMKFVYDIGGVVCRACDIGDMLDSVEDFPAADVAPVVRCKDCRKGIPDSEHATAYSCYGIWHKPDWFCAGGVRKDGDGE